MKNQPGPVRSDRPFHLANEKYAAASLRRALENGVITKEDAVLITDFVAEIKSTKHIGPSRFNKLTQALIVWRHYIGPYSDNTIRDIHRGIIALESATYQRFCPPYISEHARKPPREHPYKQNTRHDFVKYLKRFYLWLIEQGSTKITQAEIMKIQPPSCDPLTKNADDILSGDEILAMIRGCQNSRDRAIIATLYESGVRIQELATLSWSQLTFDEYGVIINIDARTGKKTCKPRYIRLVMAREYLSTWHDDYPFLPEGKALVFLTSRGRPLQYCGVAKQIREIAERVNIQKNVTPHLFRHSRITHLLQQGYSIQTIKLMMWGSLSSNMISVYAHLSNRDVDAEVLERNGIHVAQKEPANIVPVHQGPHCH
ncbi:MAG: tyrosine-type recombinase/integrase [Methanoregula sp.]